MTVMERSVESPAERHEGAMTIAVVICDDHPAFARGLARLLTDEAPDISVSWVVTDGRELEQLLPATAADVVLMDVLMPGADGVEMTARVRLLSPTTKVVILTASDDPGHLYRALRAGASAYVGKDRDVTDIAAAVRAVCRGQVVLPAQLANDVLYDLEHVQSKLSEVEQEILAGLARGETNRDLATRLHLSERTVRRRVVGLYSKLHLSDRLDAAIYAAKRGYGGTDKATNTEPRRPTPAPSANPSPPLGWSLQGGD